MLHLSFYWYSIDIIFSKGIVLYISLCQYGSEEGLDICQQTDVIYPILTYPKYIMDGWKSMYFYFLKFKIYLMYLCLIYSYL